MKSKRSKILLVLHMGSFLLLFCLLSFCVVLLAVELVEKEPFENLKGISALGSGKVELSSEVVREGKTSLKFSAVVNPQDALVVKEFAHPVDLSNFNVLIFWIYPDVPDSYFSLEVKIVIWNDKKQRADWHTIGNFSPGNMANQKWSRQCFYIDNVPKKKVLRHFDIIAWHFTQRQNQPLIFYLDNLSFESIPFLEQSGLLTNGRFERELVPWSRSELWREGKAHWIIRCLVRCS